MDIYCKNAFFCLAFLMTIYLFVDCQNDDVPEGRLIRFHGQRLNEGQSCEYENRPGICRRRSRCKLPTRKLCRGGLVPIVCCLEEPKPTQPTRTTSKPIRTTPKPIRTTPKSIRSTSKPIKDTTTKMEEFNEIDLVFPGCGTRSPGAPKKDAEPPKQETRSRNRGGWGRRRGGRRKRFASEELVLIRKPRSKIQPVIVGGVTVKPYSWPWMVAIFKKTGSISKFLCGGSLISKNYVLSAAHCFTSNEAKEPSKFTVSLGAHSTKDGTNYNVESIKIHPMYKQGQYYYDMSIIKLKEEVVLGNKVHPVCLPSDSLRSRIGNTNKNLTVTGWGDTTFGGISSKVLQEVDLPIVPLKQCNESYHKVARRTFPDGITQLFICAGLSEGGKDACQGDSGGPLVMEMEDGNFVQLGVVSFGMGCAQAGYPGVYTRVSRLTKWIQENSDLGKRQ